MDTEPPHTPDAFGVFKPIDHIVAGFKTQPAAQNAMAALMQSSLVDKRMHIHTSVDMLDLAEQSLRNAGVMAAFGFELELARLHLSLAQAGCSFLVVHTDEDEETERVGQAMRASGAVVAHRYGTFMVQELIGIDPNIGTPQALVESPPAPPSKSPLQKQQPGLAQAQADFTAEGAPPSTRPAQPST